MTTMLSNANHAGQQPHCPSRTRGDASMSTVVKTMLIVGVVVATTCACATASGVDSGGAGSVILRPDGAIGEGWLGGDALFTWCEPDTWSPVAEFHNTWSNVPYCIVGALTVHTGGQHPALSPLRMVGVMLIAIGVGSMLFHGTLTRVGQAADELAILWWEVAMLLLLYPRRSTTIWMMFVFENSVYWLMDSYPEVGWLMYHPAHTAIDLFVVYSVYTEAATSGQRGVRVLVTMGLALFAVAGVAWGLDFTRCVDVQHLHLHAYGWHLFSCAAIAVLHLGLALILLRRANVSELPILFAKFKVD